jgi:hypothetical protein
MSVCPCQKGLVFTNVKSVVIMKPSRVCDVSMIISNLSMSDWRYRVSIKYPRNLHKALHKGPKTCPERVLSPGESMLLRVLLDSSVSALSTRYWKDGSLPELIVAEVIVVSCRIMPAGSLENKLAIPVHIKTDCIKRGSPESVVVISHRFKHGWQ